MNPLVAESIYWHFPILLVTVSLIYSATRYEEWGLILREALAWGFRMACFLASIGAGLYLITVLPWWACVIVGILFAGVMMFTSAAPAAKKPRAS